MEDGREGEEKERRVEPRGSTVEPHPPTIALLQYCVSIHMI